MAKLKITKTNSVSGQIVDAYINQDTIDSARIGGTGGLTGQGSKVILPQVFITGGSSLPGSIEFQKGAHKFRVTDGTLTGTCKLTNSPNLTAGQMNIQVTGASITSASLAAASSPTGATSTYVTFTTTNVTGPIAGPRVGDYIVGFTGNAAVAQVTAVNTVGTSGNVTIALAGNVGTQSGTVADTFYASRITNKFVYDFGTDGNQIDGEIGVSSTYYSSNYNPNKFRYRLAAPDGMFVQVTSHN
jgi:hypothetical protein